jgi:hypothetical protein
VDSIAHAGIYKVQCDRGVGVLQCCQLSHTSLGLVGARQLNTYPIGASVLVYYYPQSLYAILLGSMPDWFYDPRYKLADAIVQGSNVGLYNDIVHGFPVQLNGTGIIDFSANRPTDALQLGEFGAITETGMRVFLDSFLAQFGADETTMVSAHYFDQLLRVAGHNLQVWSSGHVFESIDDEGETSAVEAYSPYPWETLGVIDSSATPAAENSVQTATGSQTKFEPVHDDLLPVHRDVTYRGYLGQGGKRLVQAPKYGTEFSRMSDTGVTVNGLLDEMRGLDGSYGLRSAHSVVIAKSPAIPAPRKIKLAEDPAGDSVQGGNYLSCGLFGDSELEFHAVAGMPENLQDDPQVVEAAVILDYVSYLFNWKGLHAFHYHAKDWAVPDEADLIAAPVVAFSSLDDNFFMPSPAEIDVKVDDRYGLTKYFNSRASIVLTPRGGISIVDAWGSEIRMTGGHIEMHAAGDLIRTAGRSIVDRAGWDGVYIANNCLDVVANLGNVSIKADANVLITGGNNRCGGILLQSLADDIAVASSTTGEQVVGGIVIRAKNSMISMLSHDIFLATNAWGDATAGRIILNCGASTDGDGSIILRGNQVISHARSCVIDAIGQTNSMVVNEYWKDFSTITNRLVVRQQCYFWDCVTVYGNLGVNGFIVSPIDETSGLTATNDSITTRDMVSTADLVETETQFLYTESDIENLEFSFRSSTVMQSTGFIAYEPVWHQMYRLGNDPSVIEVWLEQDFEDDATNISNAYPGKEVWVADDCYGQVDLAIYDMSTGAAKDRGSAVYETPVVDGVTFVGFHNNWLVIRNPST